MIQFFEENPQVQMCSPVRRQRRDTYKNQERIKTGKEFFKKVNVVTSDDLNGLIKEIRELKKANIATGEELNELKKEIMTLKNSAG